MLLSTPIPTPSVDTTIPLWQVLCLLAGAVWVLVKMYFKQTEMQRDITLLEAKVETHIDDCADQFKSHKDEHKENMKTLTDAISGLKDVTGRMEASMGFMVKAVEQFTSFMNSTRNGGKQNP